jgi:signal transduction histidine kinase/putative methionine-R-sulfoxide reductase with GAF domain
MRLVTALRELLAVLNSHRGLTEILEYLLEQTADLLGTDACAIYLLEVENNSTILKVGASHGLTADRVALKLPIGAPVSGLAVEALRPVAVNDLRRALLTDPREGPLVEDRGTHLLVKGMSDPALEPNPTERLQRLAATHPALLSAPMVLDGEARGALSLFYAQPRDFTEHEIQLASAFAEQATLALENARLRDGAQRRAVELEALYRADETLHRSLQLEDVLQALVDLANDGLRADKTSVLVWDEQHTRLVPGATYGFQPESVAKMSHPPGVGVTSLVAMTGQPVVVPDATADQRVAHRITDPENIRSLMHVPITVGGEVFGVFGVNYCEPHQFTASELRLLQGLAQRAALAIENARLYGEAQQRLAEIERRREVAEALRDLLAVVNSGRSLDAILDHVVVQASHLLGSAASAIFLPAEPGFLRVHASRGLDAEYAARRVTVGAPPSGLAFRSQHAVALTDSETGPYKAVLAVPLAVKSETYGTLTLYYADRRTFDDEEIALASTFADQAALAIENARLSERAQEAATLEERQRLARELHDAVTQTLFSASLIAEVAPRLWQRNPDEALRRLDELRMLTRGALAEMRALLLELRPGALVETPIGQLLRQLTDSTSTRARLVTELRVDCERSLPPDVHVATYRIAQEALSNVVKHAQASHVTIEMAADGEGLALSVIDDGRGFDPARVPAGHFGVSIMRERAEAIGAQLAIGPFESGGTRVALQWRDSGTQADSARLSNSTSGASPLLTNASAPAASARSRSSGRVLRTTTRKRG